MTSPPKAALLEEFATIARAMSAPHRLAILEQLAQVERGVEALAERIGISVANCSQHLQQLRRAGLVASRRDGNHVIYRLTDDRILVLMDQIRQVAERNLAEVEAILRGLSGGEEPPTAMDRDDLERALAEDRVILLDLRPDDEFNAGHIPGARNAQLDALAGAVRDAGGRAIVAYCRGPYCILSDQAVARLRAMGLTARRMAGGLPEWRADGRAVQSV
ncbi:metalloregulator ArsR/SmtB family transcription factor [Rhodobacter sp. 24-YEA-8]|uniref:ArsR/SmtB family transcription factor n=1 Tax=Rhodobacter sp. 24-YEA-8 TaxID=1884310 RepID=UPI000899507A|nr:metalloregulator ArsR/SmtB family transcription factor [Rhodobacter sp. 24-YEA-8]SEB46595.1 transcriptional regulator, ArsR family [Rhodobacter sp. 24-YEA-8]